MTREEAQQILAAHARGEPIPDVDLLAAMGVLDRPSDRKKRLPRLAGQKRIDALLVANLGQACRKVA